MKFYSFILNILRRIFKSFEKKEKVVSRLIIYAKWKRRKDINNVEWDGSFENSKNISSTKIAICIVFLYSEQKLTYLKKICSNFLNLSSQIDLTIITNTADDSKINKIKNSLTNNKNVNILSIGNLVHPYLLPWCHIQVMKNKIKDESFTHFLFTEDDMAISNFNILYWIKARETLKKFDLIPSFVRYEINDSNEKCSVDILKKIKRNSTPRVYSKENNIAFINTIQPPYQGMYLYDRELMNEYLNSSSTSPDFGFFSSEIRDTYLIRERANLGLTFFNVPDGFYNRYVFPVSLKENKIKDCCLIHHLPNKYSNDPDEPYGKLLISDLIT